MKRLLAVLPVLWLVAAAGSSPFDRLPRDAAGSIVRRGIKYAGGWTAWARKKTVQFQKTTRRVRADGTVEPTRVERHRYRLQPTFGARIEWEEEGKRIVLVNNGNFSSKLAGASEDFSPAAAREARNATFESHYLFCMPFKLTDPGTHLESLGEVTLEGGAHANRVRVTYDKGAGDAGGLHTWIYYFDSRSGRLAANHWTYAPDKYDYTEYLDDRTFDGIRLATRRRGYQADASGKAGPLVSETIYENVRFDVPLEDSLFAIPPR